jgi:hypothetical protein
LPENYRASAVGSESWLEQRVRSAANLYIKQKYMPDYGMELMGILNSSEQLQDWQINNAIFYQSCGNQGI